MWRTKGLKALLTGLAFGSLLCATGASAQNAWSGEEAPRPVPLNFYFNFNGSENAADRLIRRKSLSSAQPDFVKFELGKIPAYLSAKEERDKFDQAPSIYPSAEFDGFDGLERLEDFDLLSENLEQEYGLKLPPNNILLIQILKNQRKTLEIQKKNIENQIEKERLDSALRSPDNLQSARALEILDDISAKGGLPGAMADLAIEALEVSVACNAYTAPVWSNLYYHINDYKDEAIFDIETVKAIPDGCADAGNTIKRRWTIAITGNGLRNGPINSDNPDKMKHKFYARGKRIKVIAFYEDDILVKDFTPNGMPDPRAKVYWEVDHACIDFKFENDLTSIAREGTLASTAGNIVFCAGGCGIPGVLATK